MRPAALPETPAGAAVRSARKTAGFAHLARAGMALLALVGPALSRPGVAQAQPGAGHAQPRAGTPGHGQVTLSSRMGMAKSPFPSPEAREISGVVTSLLLDGQLAVTPALALALRLPLVLAGLDLPAGGARAQTSWGHPEVAAVLRLREGAATRLLGRLALAIPLPGGDAALARRPLDNQALLLADAQAGHHDPELYAPGRLALTPSVRLEATRGRAAAFGELELPLLLAVARGTPDARTEVRRLAITSAASAGASLSWWRLRGTAAAWLAVDVVRAAELRGQAPARWTLTVDPALQLRITGHVGAALSATIPVAGALSAAPAVAVAVTGDW
jgi:hypothetical protein